MFPRVDIQKFPPIRLTFEFSNNQYIFQAQGRWSKTLVVWNRGRVVLTENVSYYWIVHSCANVNWVIYHFYYRKNKFFWCLLEYILAYSSVEMWSFFTKWAKIEKFDKVFYFIYLFNINLTSHQYGTTILPHSSNSSALVYVLLFLHN